MHMSRSHSTRHHSRPHLRMVQVAALLTSLFFAVLVNVFTIPVFAASPVGNSQSTYVDKKFGFSLQLPAGWTASPHTSMHDTQYADVVFTNSKLPGTHLEVNVLRSSTAATTFAQQGKPTVRIGNYPAFQQDTSGGIQMPLPCLGRIMLVHNDIVTASWCAKDAATHKQAFENILATYQDHSAISTKTNTIVQAQTPVNAVLSCSQVISSGENSWGTLPSNDSNFGQQIVNPNDSTWTTSFGEGVAVCNDDNWESSYLFQCVELANRFIHEEWNLPGFNGDAFAYYDNYQNGTYYNGLARASGYNATLTPDASQGSNSALPVPGDLIIFQDVNTPSQGWTSGEISGDAGHVVVVTSVTSSQVNVVQQNWLNHETYSFAWSYGTSAYPGYHIQDTSGESHRITRGWIHFAANTNNGSSSAIAHPAVDYNASLNHPETFALANSDKTM